MGNKGKYYESQFEEATLALLCDAHWQYTYGDNIHRKYTDPLIEADLRNFLAAQYSDKRLTAAEVDGIVANLRNMGGQSDYHKLRNTFLLYRDGYDFVYSDGRGIPFRMEYIDFEHPDHNIFRCVNQFTMVQGKEERRPDILLFVNGIPVCIIELKNPTSYNATIRDAHKQICTRYVRDIPALLRFCALAVISDGAKNALGSTYTPFEYFYEWKKVDENDKPQKGLDTLRTLVRGALSPERILELLRDYVYFPDPTKEDDTTEVVCRYPQFFATRKLRDHILNHLRSVAGGDGKGGTYFGATGCGKTYTMLFLARQLVLRCRKQLGSPTILVIVDREDLESQSAKLFCRSKQFLEDEAVKVFETRNELANEMRTRKTGGIYITTVQKFAETTGLLTDRSNVICLSDEAHRSQNNIGSKLSIQTDGRAERIGAKVTYGFAKYLRDALPNATYVGFTGTPIDETIHVFGEVVDQYTMRESEEDGITVPIKYDPRLARVFLNKEQAEKIEEYYRLCADEGATPEDVEKSKAAMSSLNVIIGDDDVLRRVAKDIIEDYHRRTETTDRLQKAMITCADRPIAFKLYKIMREMQPDWFEKKKALNEFVLTADEKSKLTDIAFVNMVMTRDKDDEPELYNLLGGKEYRKLLDTEFKSEKSNFHISINVDMWVTGFDVPSLTLLYNDKPLSKHTLIQTISRVNRRYKTKEYGIVVDYIGIREEMKEAMKKYGGDVDPKEDLEVAHEVVRNELQILREMLSKVAFDRFFGDDDFARLQLLQDAAEYILANSVEKKGEVSLLKLFKEHVKRLRSAYNICNPAGLLTDEETAWSQCFMGICSYVVKMTSNGGHDTESMNKHVEQMVQEAILSSGVERVMNEGIEENIFSDSFAKEVDEMKMPHTKFQILCKLVSRAIKAYAKNTIQSKHYNEMLEETVQAYNTRDNLAFTNDVTQNVVDGVYDIVSDKINSLSDKLLGILKEMKADRDELGRLGITFEEKAFYDVLVEVRNTHKFDYEDKRCSELAKKIKALVDNTAVYADWLNNDNLKNKLATQLTYLLYNEGYPPEWDQEVFQKVLEQVENYKNNE